MSEPAAAWDEQPPELVSMRFTGFPAPSCRHPVTEDHPNGVFPLELRVRDNEPGATAWAGFPVMPVTESQEDDLFAYARVPSFEVPEGNETVNTAGLLARDTVSSVTGRDASDNYVGYDAEELQALGFPLSADEQAPEDGEVPCPVAVDSTVTLTRSATAPEDPDTNDLWLRIPEGNGSLTLRRWVEWPLHGWTDGAEEGWEATAGATLDRADDEVVVARRALVAPASPEVGDVWVARSHDGTWDARYFDGTDWVGDDLTTAMGTVLERYSLYDRPTVTAGDHVLDVSWRPFVTEQDPGAEPILGYRLLLTGMDGVQLKVERTATVDAGVRHFTWTDLPNGLDYRVRVAARNVHGWSGYAVFGGATPADEPTRTTLEAPAVLTYGELGTLTGRVEETDGDLMPSGKVTQETADAPTGPWQAGTWSERTVRDSVVTSRVAAVPKYYRLVFDGATGYLPSRSEVVHQAVRGALTVEHRLRGPNGGRKILVLHGTTGPHEPGRDVVVRRLVDGQWREPVTTTTADDGTYRVRVALPYRPGRYRFKVTSDAPEPYLDASQTLRVLRRTPAKLRVRSRIRGPLSRKVLVLSGRVRPRHADRRIIVARRVSGTWRRSVVTRTTADGTFRVRTVLPRRSGTYRYRVTYDARWPWLDTSRRIRVDRP